MQRSLTIFKVLLFALLVLSGCARNTSDNTAKKAPTENSANPVVWLEQDLDVQGMKIAVGHLGPVKAGERLEPIVTIMKDHKPVASAMVFCQLVSSDGQSKLSEEVATVFKSASSGNPACYAQGKLLIPKDIHSAAVRVRVILPDVDEEWSKDFVCDTNPTS